MALGITNITHDPLRRLGLSIFGPGTHIEKEALYYSALPVGGTPLSGANTYQLTFTKGQLPPVEAFWSLIMYGPNSQLVANPINRYELASHNPTDLNREQDRAGHDWRAAIDGLRPHTQRLWQRLPPPDQKAAITASPSNCKHATVAERH